MQWLAQPVSGQGNSFRSRLRKLPAISKSFVRRQFKSQQFLQKWRCFKLSDESPIHLWSYFWWSVLACFWVKYRSCSQVYVVWVGRQGAEMCADVNGLFKAQWFKAFYWYDSVWLPQFFEGCLLQTINYKSRPSCRAFSKCQTVSMARQLTNSNFCQQELCDKLPTAQPANCIQHAQGTVPVSLESLDRYNAFKAFFMKGGKSIWA